MPGYWLFKSEPGEYSIDDLAREKRQTTRWEGIRNYQARNSLRDKVRNGDYLLFYHSSCRTTGVAGLCEVVSEPYPDPTQFDPASAYYDSKATRDQPRWYAVDIALVRKLPDILATSLLRQEKALDNMILFKNPRLSVQQVSESEWKTISALAIRESGTRRERTAL